MHMAYAYIYSTHINCAVSELRQSRERERERERKRWRVSDGVPYGERFSTRVR